MADSGEKTEKATPKRKKDERKKGNVFQSHEILIVVSMLATFFGLQLLGPVIVKTLGNSVTMFFSLGATVRDVTPTDVTRLFIDALVVFAVASAPLMLISSAVSVAVTMAQTRGLVSFESMKPKFSRISPLQGFKKMFSVRGVVELLKSLIKISVLGYILYNEFRKQLPLLPRIMDLSVVEAMALVGDMVMSIVKTAAIFFAFLALFDLLYQWWEYEKNLRMSKQEVKEEYKQTEGDPQIKGRIRERQQAQARRRMMQNVPNADVVIRNPTHFAVAIQYQPEKNAAPVVIAKGTDHIALRIVEIAQEHDIVITENVPLARGLYEAVDIDQEIPAKFYQPVAEVLAFVYSLKNKKLPVS